MRKFKFKLNALERLRRIRRKQAEGDLTRINAGIRDCDTALTDARRSLHGGFDDPLTMRTHYEAWRDRLHEEIRELEAKLREHHAKAEVAREEYRVAVREHRVIEKLRERRHAEWRVERDREEQRFLDEIRPPREVRNEDEGERVVAADHGELEANGAPPPLVRS